MKPEKHIVLLGLAMENTSGSSRPASPAKSSAVYVQKGLNASTALQLTKHQPLWQDTAYIEIHICIAHETLLLHLLSLFHTQITSIIC